MKNIKKTEYHKRRAFKAVRALQLKFFLSLMLLVSVTATVAAFVSPGCLGVEILGGATLASMMAIGSIDDVPDRDVAGSSIAYKVWLVETKQLNPNIDFPLSNASREIASLPLQVGEYMHYFEAHDIPTYVSSGEKGDLTISSTNTFTVIMGGIRDQLLTFIEQKAGCKFIIIFQECESPNLYIIGNPCKPMVLRSYNLKNDKDNRSVTFTFESTSLNQYKKYVGDIVVAAPPTLTAGATTLAVAAGKNTYNVPNGASSAYAIGAVSGLSNNDKGRIITLLGLGTTYPATIADNASFILEDGATWTARAGSRISFRVLDPATLVEIQGTRIQTV
jgi:hypothetical protein